jgi:hypothetical protein
VVADSQQSFTAAYRFSPEDHFTLSLVRLVPGAVE